MNYLADSYLMMMQRLLIAFFLLRGVFPGQIALANDTLSQAIQAYRQGNYIQAQQFLAQPPEKQQDQAKWAYYTAITAAQLTQTDVAADWYEKVIRLYPGTPEATMAQQGLQALETNGNLDRPPGVTNSGNTPSTPTGANNDMLQALLPLMMSSGGKGGGGGLEWMLMSQMMQNGNSANGTASPIDPAVLSNMINAQMMGQMNLGLDSKSGSGE